MTRLGYQKKTEEEQDGGQLDLVGIIDVASEGRPDDVSLLVNNLDDVRSDLVGLILHDGGIGPVVHVQVQQLA